MSYKQYIIPFILILSIAANVILLFHNFNSSNVETVIVEKHDTVSFYDTVLVSKPVACSEKVVKDSVFIYKESLQSSTVIVDTDSIYVEMPVEQKIYKQDSMYECQVSGYNPNLDWIKVFPKTEVITNTKTITVKDKPQLLDVRIGVGVGYGIINKKLDVGPYVGVGIHL